MNLIRKNGSASNVLRFKILDNTTGQGKTGLDHSSSGLVISTLADNEAAATAYTVAASHVEAIGTLGTFAAPSASCCRFAEVDATHHPGTYELQLADARFAVSGSKALRVTLSGVSGMQEAEIEIQLSSFDLDSVRLAATALDDILIESGITATVNLTDDSTTQLTAINARQAISVCLSVLAGVLADDGSGTATFQAGGKPSVSRVLSTLDPSGRLSAELVVPV